MIITDKESLFTLADLKEAYEEGYYEGAGDDAWYRDHPTADSTLKENASVKKPMEDYINNLLENLGLEEKANIKK